MCHVHSKYTYTPINREQAGISPGRFLPHAALLKAASLAGMQDLRAAMGKNVAIWKPLRGKTICVISVKEHGWLTVGPLSWFSPRTVARPGAVTPKMSQSGLQPNAKIIGWLELQSAPSVTVPQPWPALTDSSIYNEGGGGWIVITHWSDSLGPQSRGHTRSGTSYPHQRRFRCCSCRKKEVRSETYSNRSKDLYTCFTKHTHLCIQ